MIQKNTSKIVLEEIKTFSLENFKELCNHLANHDSDLELILENHGYPPMWTRKNSFETLVHIILEQQVSLASALATLNKLKKKIKEITPENILALSDKEMRECYVSRQKNIYIRGLADAILNKEIDLANLPEMSNSDVRKTLVSLKGIGNWTVDVYLMSALQRTDIFPIGDLAAVNALKRLKQLSTKMTKEELLEITEPWKPFRSGAAMMLWHYYLSTPKTK